MKYRTPKTGASQARKWSNYADYPLPPSVGHLAGYDTFGK
jgi:hypothetical protein